jgi:hypothetical protein
VPRNRRAHTSAVVAIQRFGSHLGYPASSVRSLTPHWHIHLHAVISDAVWILRDGALVTIVLPPPTYDDVETIVFDIWRRTTAYIDCGADY